MGSQIGLQSEDPLEPSSAAICEECEKHLDLFSQSRMRSSTKVIGMA